MLVVQQSRIIAVTGTKGKTSVARAIHYALQANHTEPILGVDTHRIVLGADRIATFNKSVRLTGLLPTVSPGKFLMLMEDTEAPVAVLEASLGSARSPGLGYHSHEVGIFTNVYDDHLGTRGHLQTREDLAREKSFIFSAIKHGGYAVYNADDELVSSRLEVIDESKEVKTIGCSLDRTIVDGADYSVTVEDGVIVVKQGGDIVGRADILQAPWLFSGEHTPSLYNAFFVVGALWAYSRPEPESFDNLVHTLITYAPEETGGRMVVRTAENGARVIIDFAHESVSMSHVAMYARKLAGAKRVIGVVRLSGDRPDGYIFDTTKKFSEYYDELFIYDKEAGTMLIRGRQQGDVSIIMKRAADEAGIKSAIISKERDALDAAAQVSRDGDVIVYIIKTSVGNYELADSVFHFKENIS